MLGKGGFYRPLGWKGGQAPGQGLRSPSKVRLRKGFEQRGTSLNRNCKLPQGHVGGGLEAGRPGRKQDVMRPEMGKFVGVDISGKGKIR